MNREIQSLLFQAKKLLFTEVEVALHILEEKNMQWQLITQDMSNPSRMVLLLYAIIFVL